MKKILVLVSGNNGCTLHRILLPYTRVNESKSEKHFSIDFYSVDGKQINEVINFAESYDIIVYHRFLPTPVFEALKGKKTLIADLDDYWTVNTHHPLYSKMRDMLGKAITEQLKQTDYVTTTTELFAKKIRLLNNNVAVFPNALVKEGQFESHGERKPYIRIGWVGGSSHGADIAMLQGVVNQLPQDVKNRIQFVLCGFDKGNRIIMMPDGTQKTQQMDYRETCWGEWERIFTDNYKNVTPEYKDWLLKFFEGVNVITDERYRRIWTKPIDTYATHYDEMDVVLIPLKKDFFNECKSPLKLIECSVKGKAVIISDVEPYTSLLRPLITKGGEIDPEGNVIAIADNKNAKAWAKAIVKLVNNPELIDTLSKNLQKLTEEGAEYNLDTVTEKRILWLNEICEKI